MKILVQDKTGGREIDLAGEMIVGRHEDCDLRLEDSAVSGRHLRIRALAGGIYFEDLVSTNGTSLDGRVMEGGICENGSAIRIGETTIRPMASAPDEAKAAKESMSVLMTKPADDPLFQENSFDRVLFEISLLLTADRDLPAFFGHLLDMLMRDFPSLSAAGIILWKNISQPELAAHRARSAPPTVSRKVIRSVLEKRGAVLFSDVPESALGADREIGRSLIAGGIESLLAAPIMRGGEVIGVLQLEAPLLPFVESDLRRMMVIGNIIGAVIEGATVRKAARAVERDKAMLERYVSRDVVDHVLKAEDGLKMGGEARDVTIFFSDIRGYTGLSETLAAEELVRILNLFFEQIARTIFDHGGTIDKFIGDAVMAVFGSPVRQPDDARRACRMSLEVRRVVDGISQRIQREKNIVAKMGYGLTSGKVVSGNIGWEKRMEHTCIGDTVNLAARLSGLAGPGEILMDEETARRAGRVVTRERGEMSIKGKARPVPVFQLVEVVE